MTKKFLLPIIIIAFLTVILLTIYIQKNPLKINYSTLNLEEYDKLMIVAHPDDEMIWGGGELIKENYLVVCITCGQNKVRVAEFEKVMHETNDRYLMLGYPDKTKGRRDDWRKSYHDIESDIGYILNLKNWQKIITHNPEGEYGHIHHKMTNKIVTDQAPKDKLYYFGRYYTKKQLSELIEEPTKLPEQIVKRKIDILQIYQSQDFINNTFNHMFDQENMIRYQDWQEVK